VIDGPPLAAGISGCGDGAPLAARRRAGCSASLGCAVGAPVGCAGGFDGRAAAALGPGRDGRHPCEARSRGCARDGRWCVGPGCHRFGRTLPPLARPGAFTGSGGVGQVCRSGSAAG